MIELNLNVLLKKNQQTATSVEIEWAFFTLIKLDLNFYVGFLSLRTIVPEMRF